jgi:hypothetical protein
MADIHFWSNTTNYRFCFILPALVELVDISKTGYGTGPDCQLNMDDSMRFNVANIRSLTDLILDG